MSPPVSQACKWLLLGMRVSTWRWIVHLERGISGSSSGLIVVPRIVLADV